MTNQEITRRGILSKTAAGTVVSLAGCVGEEYMEKIDDGQIRTYRRGWNGEIEIFKTQTQAYIEIDIDYKTFTGDSRSSEGYEAEPSLEIIFYSNIGYKYLWDPDKRFEEDKSKYRVSKLSKSNVTEDTTLTGNIPPGFHGLAFSANSYKYDPEKRLIGRKNIKDQTPCKSQTKLNIKGFNQHLDAIGFLIEFYDPSEETVSLDIKAKTKEKVWETTLDRQIKPQQCQATFAVYDSIENLFVYPDIDWTEYEGKVIYDFQIKDGEEVYNKRRVIEDHRYLPPELQGES